MSRSAQNLMLVLVGASVALSLGTGAFVNYVRPSLMPWLAAAAVATIVLGLAGVVHDLRSAGQTSQTNEDHRHWASLVWLLLVPIALLAFVVPPALDARGATAAHVTVAPPPQAFPPLPNGPSPTVPVPEVVMRAAADPMKSLDGRTITVAGFTLRYPDGIYLGRVVIVCCAADAQLARIRLAGTGANAAGAFDDDTWVQLQGKVEAGSAQPLNGFIPTMKVASVSRIDKPPNTYAY